MEKFKRYLLLSQINLFAWLILASIIVSSVVLQNGGVSNFGNHYSTVILYSAAFIACAVYIFLAAKTLVNLSPKFKNLSRYMYVLGALLLLVYLTTFPRRYGAIYSDIHDNVSKAFFVYELLLAVWLTFKRPVIETFIYLFIMVGGSLLGFLSSIHVLHLMFVGQMVGELGFALLFIMTLPKVITAELAKKPHKQRTVQLNRA